MTQTPDPREDALARAKRAIDKVVAWLEKSEWGTYQYMESSAVYEDKDDAKDWLEIALAALSALPSQSEATAKFVKQHYGATVATILETDDSIVEVQERNDGVYGLIVHHRREDRDNWDDLTAYLKPEHFDALGSVACRMRGENAPSPTPYVRPAAVEALSEDATICPKCQKSVSYKWQNGFIPEPHNALIADQMFHAECWDEIEADMPPFPPAEYVRPAAEIRAEIEQAKRHYGLSLKLEGYVAGLTFALTPPTQEPR